MSVPSPWIALLLLGASYRIWKLLADDTILNRPRHWLVRLPPDWEEGDPLPRDYRLELARFITCPWCLGFHVSWVLWLAWEIEPHWTAIFSVPFALSAALGITERVTRDDD